VLTFRCIHTTSCRYFVRLFYVCYYNVIIRNYNIVIYCTIIRKYYDNLCTDYLIMLEYLKVTQEMNKVLSPVFKLKNIKTETIAIIMLK